MLNFLKISILLFVLFPSTSPSTEVYLPMVFKTQSPVGYAGENISQAKTTALGMKWYTGWWVQPNGSHSIPYTQSFGCDVTVTGSMYPLLVELGEDFDGFLLFLNEPDATNQCTRTPQEAVLMYNNVINIVPNAKIIGPSPTQHDYLYHNWDWTREFYEILVENNLPMPTHASIHFYGNWVPYGMSDSLFDMLSEFDNAPTTAWVTEFGSFDPDVLTDLVKMYQSDPRILRYAVFSPAGTDGEGFRMINDDNTLTPLGEAWVAVNSQPTGVK